MKERMLALGDGVISIIMTIMVFDFPKIYSSSGQILWSVLVQSLLIYFISFCFLANLWFQLTEAFAGVREIRNKQIVLYFLLLFFLSLVPTATNLVVKDPNREVVFLYGLLTLWVTIFMEFLLRSLLQLKSVGTDNFSRLQAVEKQEFITIGLRFILLIFSYFFTTIALFIYLILPIANFLENIIEREEEEFLGTIGNGENQNKKRSLKEVWRNPFGRYVRLLRSSMDDETNPRKRFVIRQGKDLYERYDTELTQKIATVKEQLQGDITDEQRAILEKRLADLQEELTYLQENFPEFKRQQLENKGEN